MIAENGCQGRRRTRGDSATAFAAGFVHECTLKHFKKFSAIGYTESRFADGYRYTAATLPQDEPMSAGEQKIRIVFRGVRGSYPVPGPDTLRYGGNTTSQEIRVGGRLLVFDAGTGIISLGQDLANEGGPCNLALFFSHNHHDHTGGILYFKPAYSPDTMLHIFGPDDEPGTIIEALERLSAPAAHPVQLARMGMHFTCDILADGSLVRWSPGEDAPRLEKGDYRPAPDDIVVRVLKNSLHPVGGVLNFRLEYLGKTYVYATDVEGDEEKGDPRLVAFAAGADLLAHDGQYTSEEYFAIRKGWGHSTVRMAIRTAELAGVKRLAIIHHEPTYDDDKLDAMQAEAQREFPNLFFAREGQAVEL